MSEGTLSGGTVSLPIRPNTAGFGKSLGEGLLAESGNLLHIGKAMGAKLLAGFALVEIGVKVAEQIGDSIKVAKDAEAATVQLKVAVKNAGFEYDDYAKKISNAQVAGRKFGFTNEQTTNALSQLTIGLKDPAKALQVLGVAQDLAVAKHMDLNSAALLVTKGMEGQVRPLKALGIDIPIYAGNAQAVALAQNKVAAAQQKVNDILAKTPNAVDASSSAHAKYEKAVEGLSLAQQQLTDKQSSGDQILKALSDRLGGSAAAAADTYAGKQAALKATVDNFKDAIGTDLLLVLDKLITKFGGPVENALTGFASWLTGPGATAISQGIDWIGKYKDVLGPAAAAITAVAVAGFVLDAAMDANPIGAVVLGVEALIGLVTVLATNFGGFTQTLSNFGFAFYQIAYQIAGGVAGIFQGLVNGVIGMINTLLNPLNAIITAAGGKAIKLNNVDFTSGLKGLAAVYSGAQTYANTTVFGAGGGYGSTGSGSGGSVKPAKAFATGGTVMPTPGGSLVRVAEANRSETIVDTETLQAAMTGRSGDINVYESSTPYATAVQVARIQNMRIA